ncbi:MAG: PleD family two-component system response regulator, partial [Sphingobacteriales bacterium]
MIPINILIADYKEENKTILNALPKRDDVELFFTRSTNEALKLAWQKQVAAAIINIHFPENDGLELTEMLRSNPNTKDILVIFLIDRSKEVELTADKSLDCSAYLYKPLDP